MPGTDTLEQLRADFVALPGRKRRAILAALSDEERAEIIAMLEPAPSLVLEDPARAPLSGCSAWLSDRFNGAAAPGDQAEERWTLTPASKAALIEAVDSIQPAVAGERPAVPIGPTLVGAFASMLAGRSAR